MDGEAARYAVEETVAMPLLGVVRVMGIRSCCKVYTISSRFCFEPRDNRLRKWRL